MRFMMFMYPNPSAEAGQMPTPAQVEEMMKYNEALLSSGALLSGEGLHPSSKGARVRFSGGRPTVTDGPFSEAKEVVGGYWMIQVRSKEEAIEWAKRAPMGDNEIIEVRQVQEISEFPSDVQEAAAGLPGMQKPGRR